MIKMFILGFLYFCITGCYMVIRIKTFDFSKIGQEALDEYNNIVSTIQNSTHWSEEQIINIVCVLGLILGWVLVPYGLIHKLIKYKGLTKSK